MSLYQDEIGGIIYHVWKKSEHYQLHLCITHFYIEHGLIDLVCIIITMYYVVNQLVEGRISNQNPVSTFDNLLKYWVEKWKLLRKREEHHSVIIKYLCAGCAFVFTQRMFICGFTTNAYTIKFILIFHNSK